MNKVATRTAYGETLVELGKINKDIIVLDADLSKSTKTALFGKAFPDRFVNVGIAEQDLIGTAAGFASTGKIVFASTFAMFATLRAFEQIRNTVAYSKLNVKVCPSHAGISVGPDGSSHQPIEDISIIRSIPNMVVISPGDYYETREAIKFAAEYYGPMYIRLSRLKFPIVFDENYKFELGKGIVLKEGHDVTLMAHGLMLTEIIEAAELLKKDGIDARVINMPTIKPLDKELCMKCANETKFILTLEEHSVIGGLGSAIAEYLSEEKPTKVIRMGVNDVFGQSGEGEELIDKYGLRAINVVERVKKELGNF